MSAWICDLSSTHITTARSGGSLRRLATWSREEVDRQLGGGNNPDPVPNGCSVEHPENLAGPGTRGARLGPHGKRAARRAKGLEGALIDRERVTIGALDPDDGRTVEMWVAGPGALLVAKVHKISERVGSQDRVRDKDALDVLRLLRSIETEHLRDRLSMLRRNDLSAVVTAEAVGLLPDLFATTESAAVAMVVRAAGPGEDPAPIAGSIIALVEDLVAAFRPST